MRFQNIEVSGIVSVVINQRHIFHKDETGNWFRSVTEHLTDGRPVSVMEMRSHKEMMAIVNHLKKNRKFRMWIHLDTLNIVRR